MDGSLASLVVVEALVASYPAWTDEHGVNVEQLAAVAVHALAEHGLLAEPVERPPIVNPDRPAPAPSH